MSQQQAGKSRFAKNALVYGIGGLSLQIAGFILLPLYTHYLTPAEYGVLELINRTGQFVLIGLMVNGLRMATLTFYQQSETPEERSMVAATQSFLVFLVVVIVGALVLILSPWLAHAIDISDANLLAFGLLATFLEATLIVPMALIQARVESTTFVIASISMLVVRVTLAILALSVFGLGLWGVLGATAVTSAIFGLALTLREFLMGSFKIDFKHVPAAFKYAMPFLPAGILAFVLMSSDRYFLNEFATRDELGFYSLAAKLAGVVALFSVTPIYRVWSAEMYKAADLPNASQKFGAMYLRIMLSFTFMGMLLCIYSPEVLLILGSSSYEPATNLIPPLVLAQYFYHAACVLDAAFYVRRKTKYKPWITLVATIATLTVFSFVIPAFGVHGAVWGSVFGFGVYWIVTFCVAQKTFHSEIHLWRSFLPLALGAIVVLLCGQTSISIAGELTKMLILSAWVITVWSLDLISSDDKNSIRKVIRKVISKRTNVEPTV